MSGGRNPDDYYISGSTSGVHPYLHRELMNKMNMQTKPMNEFMKNYKGGALSDTYMNLANDINRLIMSYTGNKSLAEFLFKQLVKYFGKESSMNVGGVSFDEVKNKSKKAVKTVGKVAKKTFDVVAPVALDVGFDVHTD